jgi:hypothetical protein
VTGSGTAFTSQIQVGQWIKKTADSETLFVQVASVISDTALTLSSAYAGTTASTTGVVSSWLTVTASGGSIALASSIISLASGTTSGQKCYIQRLGDYLPYTFQAYAAISQRIANQNVLIGFQDTFTGTKQAVVQFTGTTNTQVNFITAFSSAASDIQTTTVTLPNGATTSSYNLYKIDIAGNQATLSINGTIVAVNAQHLPGPYDNLNVFAGISNTGVAASSTTLTVDYIYFYNCDRVQIDSDFGGEPIKVDVVGTVANSTLSNVSGSASSVTLLAANTGRRGAIIVNDSSAVLYVKFGSSASNTSYTYRLVSYATLEIPQPIYSGIITGIWASATGAARITELLV